MSYTYKFGDRPLEGYVIQRAVGRGGFGEVYYALSDAGREVAIKYLRNNPEIELRGVSQCMNLKSPHLVTIYDIRESAAGEKYIVMEYVTGPSLRDLLIASPKGLGIQKAAYFLREIAKGLAYLHDRGIVHRDLKPGNILCDEGRIKIGDYGLSKFMAVSHHSGQTASVGTVHYMAPEIGSGNYSRGIDIYALGVILYEMLLGKVPFDGSSLGEVVIKHMTMQPEVDELPAPFPEVIRKALAKDPKDRYDNVKEMLDAAFASPDLEMSLAGFEPMSLTQAAAAVDIANRIRAESPMPPRTPVRPGSSHVDAQAGIPVPSSRTESVSPTLNNGLADQKRQKRWGMGLIIAGSFLLVTAPAMVIIDALDGGRIHGESAAALVIMGVLALQSLGLGIFISVRLARQANRPLHRKLELPLQRSFVIHARSNLHDMVHRYFSLQGFKLVEHESLLWRFERGTRAGEWTGDIRKYKTRLNIASFDDPQGQRLCCTMDVENPWGWAGQTELRRLYSELEGFEDLVNSTSGYNVLNPEKEAVAAR